MPVEPLELPKAASSEYLQPISGSFLETIGLAKRSSLYRARRVQVRQSIRYQRLGQDQADRIFAQKLAASVTTEELEGEPDFWKLVTDNLGLVNHFVSHFHHDGVSYEDRLQVGFFGLIRAIEKYDPQREIRLSVYARDWIRMTVDRYARNDKLIPEPDYVWEKRRKQQAVEERARQVPAVLSIFTPVGEEGDYTLEDTIPNSSEPAEDQALKNVIGEYIGEYVDTLLQSLEPKARLIISLRFGLGGLKDRTLKEIGELFGETAPGIRYLEQKALKQLKELIGKENLPDLIY